MKRLCGLLLFTITLLCCAPLAHAQQTSPNAHGVRVMAFNIWVDGEAGGQPLAQTAEVIKKAQADIVGLQEIKPGTAKELAGLLGWNYVPTPHNVLTRLDIAERTDMGIKVKLDNGQEAYVFSIHLHHAPYQPYQLLSIPYHDGAFLKTEQEAIAAAQDARGHQLVDLLSHLDYPS